MKYRAQGPMSSQGVSGTIWSVPSACSVGEWAESARGGDVRTRCQPDEGSGVAWSATQCLPEDMLIQAEAPPDIGPALG